MLHEALQTRILIDCTAAKTSALEAVTCPLRALVGPHVIAAVGDFRDAVKTAYGSPPIEAYLFDSARAADAYEIAGTYTDSKGNTLTPFIRLQRRNVVVWVVRRGDYRRKAEAALAALG